MCIRDRRRLVDIKDHPEWSILKDKYSNPNATHHYEITQSSGPTSGSGPSDYSHMVECNSDEDNPSIITNREYEQRLQDKYRQIRLLDKKYLKTFVNEFEGLIKGA